MYARGFRFAFANPKSTINPAENEQERGFLLLVVALEKEPFDSFGEFAAPVPFIMDPFRVNA
jgi:hypothetical protein